MNGPKCCRMKFIYEVYFLLVMILNINGVSKYFLFKGKVSLEQCLLFNKYLKTLSMLNTTT